MPARVLGHRSRTASRDSRGSPIAHGLIVGCAHRKGRSAPYGARSCRGSTALQPGSMVALNARSERLASMKTHYGAVAMVLSVALALTVAAQQRQSRQLSGFDAIEVGGGLDLVVRKGDTFVIEVAAKQDDLEKITTEVVGKTLQIKRKSNFF